MCLRTGKEFKTSSLTLNDISAFRNYHFTEVKHCGNLGDPIFSPDFLEIVKFFSDRCDSQIVETNGSAYKFWGELGKISNLKVVFGIDGVTQESHARYRINTRLSRILENAQEFINSGGEAHWSFIRFKHNEHEVEEARRIAKYMGFAEFNLIETRRFMDKDIIAYGDDIMLERPSGNLIGKEELKGDTVVCRAQKNESIYIDANGNVYACPYLTDSPDYKHKSHLNIKNKCFDEIVFDTEFDDILVNQYNSCVYNCKYNWRNGVNNDKL
jgi:MoaA/NifB/PqqE/SkfB family radical SAM enzyme